MNIRTIIVDDEFLARRKLNTLLTSFPFIQLLGEARNGKEALDLIRLKEPDLVFLDIEMPGMSGIELAEEFSSLKQAPFVIFSTAYDSFAVKAFETEAIDYLLKPYEHDRLKAALDKIKERMQLERARAMNDNIFQLLNYHRKADDSYRHIFEIKKNGRDIHIPVDEIVYIQAEGNYAELISRESKFLYRATMNKLEMELDPEHFLRIHRSLIVNVHFIQSCKYQGNASYKVRLKTQQELISGRSYKAQIAAFMGKK